MGRSGSLLAALLCGLASPASPQGVDLRSGQTIAAGVLSIDSATVVLDDGRTLPRSSVREVQMAIKRGGPSSPAAPGAVSGRWRKLFKKAAALGKIYPGMDGLILLSDDDYRLREDGAWTERNHFIGQVLKEGLRGSWGQVTAEFEEGRSRARIVQATVYHPDGRSFPLERSRIKTLSPQAGTLFFTEERRLSYALPELEPGSIVEWETEVETYNPFRKDFFFPSDGFQAEQPIAISRLAISIPASQRLYYAARNFKGPFSRAADPVISTGAGERRYVWTLRDVPPIVSEPAMPPYFDYAPNVEAALFKSWNRIYDWLGPMYEERTKPGPELAAFTRNLVRGCATPEGKAAKIYHYIQREIRYIAVKMGVASGWGGYDANLTWKRRYGCCIDKALLFTAMLKAAGIRSTPVLLSTNGSDFVDFKVPSIWFEHAITRLDLGGRKIFLDSTGYDDRFPSFPAMDQGAKTLAIFPRKVVPVPVPRPRENESSYDFAIALSTGGGASVLFSARYTGAAEAGLRRYYKSLKRNEQERSFEDWVNALSPDSSLRRWRIGHADNIALPLTISLVFQLRSYAVRSGDIWLLALPDDERDFPEAALPTRRYAVVYPTSEEKRYRWLVSLPAGWKIAALPPPVKLRGPLGERFAQECRQQRAAFVCESDFRRPARVIPVSDYAEHKKFLDRVSRITKDRIFLQADGK
jgi:transglutaminase-like putative cysteine protease